MTTLEFLQALERRALEAGVTLPEATAEGLAIYFELLSFWNQKVNLVGFSLGTPTDAAIDRLFVEPLVATRAVRQPVTTMIDIGSGGGSPAFPMILGLAPKRAVLVEARTRKGVFLKEVARNLRLADVVEVRTTRFEDLNADSDCSEAFCLLTLRAVRVTAPELLALKSFLRPEGQMCLFGRTEFANFPLVSGITFNGNVSLPPSNQIIAALAVRT